MYIEIFRDNTSANTLVTNNIKSNRANTLW